MLEKANKRGRDKMSSEFHNNEVNNISNSNEVEPSLIFFEEENKSEQDSVAANNLGRTLYRMAKIYYDKADLVMAKKYFIKSYNCADGQEDNYSVLKALGFLIRISSELLESEEVSKYVNQAKVILNQIEAQDQYLGAEYFYNGGIIENYSGNFESANDFYVLAQKKAKENNEPDVLAKINLALAMNAFNRKKFDEALDIVENLEQLLQIVRKTYLYGTMLFFKSYVLIELNKYDEALECLKIANITLQKKKCWNLYGHILLAKAIAYKNLGDFKRSLNGLNLALESTDQEVFKRLTTLLKSEIKDVNDSSVDLYLDKTNRLVKEKNIGTVDFKHRFVLLEILFLLAKSPGNYFDKDHLARLIWKDEYNPLIHDKLIYTSVSRLRKLIEPTRINGEKRKYIIRGKEGYAFCPNANIRFHMETKTVIDKAMANVELCSPV